MPVKHSRGMQKRLYVKLKYSSDLQEDLTGEEQIPILEASPRLVQTE